MAQSVKGTVIKIDNTVVQLNDYLFSILPIGKSEAVDIKYLCGLVTVSRPTIQKALITLLNEGVIKRSRRANAWLYYREPPRSILPDVPHVLINDVNVPIHKIDMDNPNYELVMAYGHLINAAYKEYNDEPSQWEKRVHECRLVLRKAIARRKLELVALESLLNEPMDTKANEALQSLLANDQIVWDDILPKLVELGKRFDAEYKSH